MAATTTKLSSLRNLLEYQCGKEYVSEIELKAALNLWIKQAGNLSLKTVLQKYLAFIENHVILFEKLSSEQKLSFITPENGIMESYINDVHERLRLSTDMQIKDAALLAAIQSINHFKISSYGTLSSYAKELGMEATGNEFRKAEENEIEIDRRLTELAEKEINVKAKSPIAISQ